VLRSYVAFSAGGKVVLRQEVLDQLDLGPDGVLYGALCPVEKTVILSPIPPRYWESAFKVVVHTKHLPGSLALAAECLAQMGFDTVAAWASTESSSGHLCCTFILVANEERIPQLGGSEHIRETLAEAVSERLSDLPVFGEQGLMPVSVSPLAVLAAYGRQLKGALFCRVEVQGYCLRLDCPDAAEEATSLWSQLLVANDSLGASTCVISSDNEEALLRVTALTNTAMISHLSFRVVIESNRDSFAGYWQHALDKLAERKYSVFVAHNLLVSKNEDPPSEEAEYRFLVDRTLSTDAGQPLKRLEKNWKDRLVSSYGILAGSKGDRISIERVTLRTPRGVGVPCFFSSNAKPGKGLPAEAAVEICHMLQAHGFRPVSVDVAKGGEGLRGQIRDMVNACRFMVVMNCPDEGVLRSPNRFGVSEWVTFEEGIMEASQGEILRLRFEDVIVPSYSRGYVEVVIPRSGLDDPTREIIGRRLERWQSEIPALYAGQSHLPEIPPDALESDLASFFEG